MELVFDSVAVKLYHGDASRMDAIEDHSIDLILSDPPYGIRFISHHRKIAPREDIEKDERFQWILMEHFLREAHRVLKDSTAIFLFTRDDQFPKLYSLVKDSFKVGRTVIAAYNNWGMGDLYSDFGTACDWIIFGRKKGFAFQNERPSNVLFFKRVPSVGRRHPTEKPVPLLSYLISITCPTGGTVLDCFMGSGSTIEAAIATGRKAVGIDADEEQVRRAVERVKSITSPLLGTEDLMLEPKNFTPDWI